MHLHTIVVLVSLAALLRTASAAPPQAANPPELGDVHWGRNLENALKQSKESGKPVLLLFMQSSGCEDCQTFGREPLSHPLIVGAIESAFVPVAIQNNKPGHDAQIVKRFDEAASSLPVMRFLDGEGHDIVPRADHILSTHDVAKRLIEALATADREVPQYLKIAMLETDLRRDHRERLTFAMHCFWEGEAKLGAIDGVIGTRAMFYSEQEAVTVTFDPTVISIEDLVKEADRLNCADTVYAHGDYQLVYARNVLKERAQPARVRLRDAPIEDQDHALAQSNLRWLPLTSMQATKLNAALAAGEDGHALLTPLQMALAKRIDAKLKVDPNALQGLKRPDGWVRLRVYEEQLLDRLNRD